ncbi:MAG: alpha/beta fold hydrolase, partial [Acidimicrobiia bacterium]|nr:alpha/beta fold hydrolase [Acidimicrobiia bacterium]
MTPTPSDITRFALHCHDGVALRAEQLNPSNPARGAVVLCHPHPLHGGNMYSHVVGGLFTSLPAQGLTTLRFNFRGTSGSEGRHDGGRAERLDVQAAIEHLVGTSEAPGRPVVVIGYSFGALVGLSVDDPAVAVWVAIAPPLTMASPDRLEAAATTDKPKHLLVGS